MPLQTLLNKLEHAAADVASAYVEEHNQLSAPGVPVNPMKPLDELLKAAIYTGAIPAALTHQSINNNKSHTAGIFGFSRNTLDSRIAENGINKVAA